MGKASTSFSPLFQLCQLFLFLVLFFYLRVYWKIVFNNLFIIFHKLKQICFLITWRNLFYYAATLKSIKILSLDVRAFAKNLRYFVLIMTKLHRDFVSFFFCSFVCITFEYIKNKVRVIISKLCTVCALMCARKTSFENQRNTFSQNCVAKHCRRSCSRRARTIAAKHIAPYILWLTEKHRRRRAAAPCKISDLIIVDARACALQNPCCTIIVYTKMFWLFSPCTMPFDLCIFEMSVCAVRCEIYIGKITR